MEIKRNDSDTPVLGMLYEAYIAEQQQETERIRVAFVSLYETMNGMSIQDVDRVIYPVCTLCREHESHGFMDGVCIGIQLARELEWTG